MFVYAAAVDYNEIDEWAPMYLAMGTVYTGVGALLGWAIDSAHSKPRVRFNVPSAETMRIGVVPLVDAGKDVRCGHRLSTNAKENLCGFGSWRWDYRPET